MFAVVVEGFCEGESDVVFVEYLFAEAPGFFGDVDSCGGFVHAEHGVCCFASFLEKRCVYPFVACAEGGVDEGVVICLFGVEVLDAVERERGFYVVWEDLCVFLSGFERASVVVDEVYVFGSEHPGSYSEDPCAGSEVYHGFVLETCVEVKVP